MFRTAVSLYLSDATTQSLDRETGTPEQPYPNINYDLADNVDEVFSVLKDAYSKRNKKDPNANFDSDVAAFMNFIGDLKSNLNENKMMFKPKDLKNFKAKAKLDDINSVLSSRFFEKYKALDDDAKRPIERVMKAIIQRPSAMKDLYNLIGSKRKTKPVEERLTKILKPLIEKIMRGK